MSSLEAFYYWSDVERNKAGESLQECYDKYGTGGWESAAKDMGVQLVFLDATRDAGCSWLAQMNRPSTGEYAKVHLHENTNDTFKKKGSLVPCGGNVGTEGKAGGPPLTHASLMKLSKSDLQDKCDASNVRRSGNKDALVE